MSDDNVFPFDPEQPTPRRKRKRTPKPPTNGHAPPLVYVAPEDMGWQITLRTNNNGKPQRTLSNALIALRGAPAWAGVFAQDDFAGRVMVMRDLPLPTAGLTVPRELTETDISNTTDWLQRAEIVVTSAVTLEAIKVAAGDNRYHPVRDYLAGLTWDRVPRLDLWLVDHLGAEDTALNRAFGAKWLIGLVARVLRPGCQVDAALIFESEQGLGKSTLLRTLADPWFTDHMPDLSSKDALQQIQGVWVVELAELDSLRRAETHRIKSFISSRIDRFRPPWGHAPADHPRQCSFAGTVNPTSAGGYLRDDTGARRFWCVACGVGWDPADRIDMRAVAAARDQLWAEALHRFLSGEVWHLETRELELAQAEAAEERQEDDPRERKVRDYVAGRTSVHLADILGPDCLCVPVERWTHGLRIEIGLVMAVMKWRRQRVTLANGKREWRYLPPRQAS